MQAAKNLKARNAARIAQVQALRATKNATRAANANKAAYMFAVQQLAAQYGLPAPTQAQRAVSTVQKHAASTQPGACKLVRAYVAANPTASVAQVKAHFAATINPATVQTQYYNAKRTSAQ